MSAKTHFRKVYKSDHLGVADLEEFLEEGVVLNFNIKTVRQEINVAVAGRKGNYNIAYFVEPIKPLVLNVTNANIVRSFNDNSAFVEDWANTPVTLYIDSKVKMKGEVVGGVRISPKQPKATEPKVAFTDKNFELAKKNKATIGLIKSKYTLTPAMEKKYLDYVAKN